jgi:hypothetical protein
LPGRNKAQAREAFLEPLRRSLSRLTTAQLLVSPEADIEALKLSRDPLPLRSTVIRDGVQLRLRHQYRFVEDDNASAAERWHVSTVAYDYRMSRADGSELLSWHWHPETGQQAPHMHVARGPVPRKVHLPTSRVSIESVIRLLLADLGVKARRADWPAVLSASEDSFLKYRRWHG